jgi:hypothetical protein
MHRLEKIACALEPMRPCVVAQNITRAQILSCKVWPGFLLPL